MSSYLYAISFNGRATDLSLEVAHSWAGHTYHISSIHCLYHLVNSVHAIVCKIIDTLVIFTFSVGSILIFWSSETLDCHQEILCFAFCGLSFSYRHRTSLLRLIG